METARIETGRKLFHLSFGILLVGLLYYDMIDIWVILAATFAGLFISSLRRKTRIPVIDWFLDRFEREDDMRTIPGRGPLFFFLGFLIVLALFDKDIALAAMTIVVLGDSISPLVGMRVGKVRHPFSDKRFIEGSIAGFAFAFIGAMLFVPPAEAFVASFVSMLVESFDTFRGRRLEDNITIPLAAGITVFLLRAVF